jgi:outer membrane protein assembly factor BamB
MKPFAGAATVTLVMLAGTLIRAAATSSAWPQTDGATLYTLYRESADDIAVALDARTGQTRWATRYPAPFRETCTEQLGPAPRSAPLVDGDRVITVSAGGLMNSFDRHSGERKWTHDLLEGTPDALRACGYASSPLAYKNTIITTAGGIGRGVIALDAGSGRVSWQSQDFQNGYSSPILIDFDGRPELVVFTFGEISGLNPDTGAIDAHRRREPSGHSRRGWESRPRDSG